jgi:hypothetical protein
MTNPVSLDRWLDLEDDPSFLELVCPITGVLAWPAIRLQVFRLLLGDLLYGTAPLVDLDRGADLRRIAAGALRAAIHNQRHPPRQSDVLLLATGAGLVPRNGRLSNRYTDHFANVLGDRAWTMESLFGDDWPRPPRSNERIGFLADHRLALAIRRRAPARAIHRNLAKELVDVAERRGRDQLGWDLGHARRKALVASATRSLATYPAQARFTGALLRRIRARLVLVEEGCYGHMAVFNATAREFGVTVAEFQHGMVSRGHDAYNVAPRLAGSAAYRLTQPSAFLGYGKWWNAQFNAPVDEKVVVGNPHRSETLRNWRPDPVRTRVIVLGDGIETEAYVALCRRLAGIVPSPLRVVFRPHPLERARFVSTADPGVVIDEEIDLYGSLASAQAVLGEASTALFEAVGLVPRILVWDTDKSRFYLGDHPFERFTDPGEVKDLLANKDTGQLSSDSTDTVWADDWRGRFLRFVADHS